jgi:hypothetical protein
MEQGEIEINVEIEVERVVETVVDRIARVEINSDKIPGINTRKAAALCEGMLCVKPIIANPKSNENPRKRP